MLREITREDAIKLLAAGEAVYMFDPLEGTFTNVLDVLSERLVADIKEEPKAPKAEKAPKAQTPKKRKEIDWGKVGACRKAGWSVPKIADEVGCSEATLYNYFKKNGDPLKASGGAE